MAATAKARLARPHMYTRAFSSRQLLKSQKGYKQVSEKRNSQLVPTLAKIAVIASAETSGDTLFTTRVEHGGDKESR